ncbi:Transmembrane_domain-containing protein [Hexamita inflata]|uniref:Transmembrane domain-containing protein n=1 Tax=Hexamita inflata TaxID=28002 RepID=A0AA86QGS6_9EUKA|nr:Transmembrane domain-containing protein [Hexamita inflata]
MTSEPSKLTEAEQKAVDEALQNARQNTAKGQFYSQIVSVVAFLVFGCSMISYGSMKLYNTFGDKTVKIPSFLFGNDFYVNIADYLTPTQQKSVRPYLTNHWHVHDIRHDFYACQSAKQLNNPRNITYSFHFKSSKPVLQFTVAPNTSMNFAGMKLVYSDTQEVVLMDKFCVEGYRTFCAEVHRFQSVNLAETLTCNSSKACTFQLKLYSHHLSEFDFKVLLSVEQQQFSHQNCKYFEGQFDLEEYNVLLVKSNLNMDHIHGAPDLHIEFQGKVHLTIMKGLCGSTGVFALLLIFFIYYQSKKSWESGIVERIISDVQNKQKVQNHIDKIKQTMKNEKEK